MSTIALCECGCGRPAPISTSTHALRGYVKGQPRRFIHGHNPVSHVLVPTEERFWAMVAKKGESECWPWQGATGSHGHGVFWLDGRNIIASRYVFMLANGPIGADLFVLHKCDNPPCCNPAHLFSGDQAANMRDMVDKGRSLAGERHTQAKLTEADVRSIRARATGRRGEATAFAAEYAITVANVCMILKRQTWRHIA